MQRWQRAGDRCDVSDGFRRDFKRVGERRQGRGNSGAWNAFGTKDNFGIVRMSAIVNAVSARVVLSAFPDKPENVSNCDIPMTMAKPWPKPIIPVSGTSLINLPSRIAPHAT